MENDYEIPELDYSELLRDVQIGSGSHLIPTTSPNISHANLDMDIEFTEGEDDTSSLSQQTDIAAIDDEATAETPATDEGRIPEFDYESLFKSKPHLQPDIYQNRIVRAELFKGQQEDQSIEHIPQSIVRETGRITKKREPQVLHLLKKVDLETTTLSIILPLFSLFHILLAPPMWNWILMRIWLLYYFLTEVSLVAGYHRFFTHQSYHCHLGLQFAMAVLGASCGFGSVQKFSGQHLAHHRHLDTEKDPQCLSLYGWWFAQWGHKLFRGNRKSSRAIFECCKTLESSALAAYSKGPTAGTVVSPSYPLIKWQDKNYCELWVLTNLLIPSILAKFLCDLPIFSGIFYLGLVRMSIIQQQWLLVGSLCHLKKLPFSTQPFDDARSATNLPLGPLMQILTFGESNHNFHHEFPGDFRNSYNWYDYDPAKWMIKVWSFLGLARHLHIASDEQIEKRRVQQQQKILDEERSKLQWGIPIDRLPIMSPEHFAQLAQRSYEQDKKALVAIEGIVHDVTPFIHDHPGGVALVICAIGKDATPAFNGAVYAHSTAARNLLATMRIARLSKSGESVQRTSWENHLLNDSKGQRIVRNRNQATYTRINYYAAGAA